MEGNSWLGVALTGSAIINHFLQLYKSICTFSGHTDNKRPNLDLSNGGIGWRGCIVEMFQLKIIPLFPCFKRVTCQEPAPELAFSYIFIHMWWNWWYPFFLFISETTCPVPSKVRRRGQATPSGLYVRHFVFFGRSDLPPQHVWLCHRHPNNNAPTPSPPPKKRA